MCLLWVYDGLTSFGTVCNLEVHMLATDRTRPVPPKKKSKTNRDRIEFRADPEFIDQITAHCEAWRMSVSSFIRQAIGKAMADNPPPEPPPKPTPRRP